MPELLHDERRLAAALLKLAHTDVFRDRCNDFDLRAVIPDLAARNAIVKGYWTWNCTPDEYRELTNPSARDYRLQDTGLMRYMAHRLTQD